ncbi:DgyrCDS197 [Dimorphilus gyrociliatus]|uniref:tRNA (34-2'-O)-methyltransferase regulator WDR6 n=1 Tax=Dimorphilus gyrociliatus TaxID=2664684 RepID=A0A7I8V6M7_9ANNE|nr:DgyrCDS197 [Dimorphilus gyrociliatus]
MEEILTICPITALAFIDNTDYLLVGEAYNVSLYCTNSKSKLFEKRLLDSHNIHGFLEQKELILAYGGKELVLFKLNDSSIEQQQRIEVTDWIKNCSFINDLDYLYVATAHNFVEIWEFTSQNQYKLKKIVKYEDNCILYSAKLFGSSVNDVVLLAGTVYNKVLIWPVEYEQSVIENSLRVLENHDGVIFSINVKGKWISTVSDDRSIRLWKCPKEDKNFEDFTIEDWLGNDIACIHTLYGHGSRVWDCIFLTNKFVSIGEDGICCIWDYNGKLIKQLKSHKGRNIWSLSAKNDNLIATGGNDSSVRLWSLNSIDQGEDNKPAILHTKLEKYFPRSLSYLDARSVIVTTDEGKLMFYHKGDSRPLFEDDAFKSYSVLCTDSSNGIVIVGNIKGEIIVIYGKDNIRKKIFNSKIYSLTMISSDEEECLFIANGDEGKMIMYRLEITSNLSLVELHNFILPKCKQRWITCGCLNISAETGLKSLICGDRSGSIHVYDLNCTDLSPSKSYHKVHGRVGVTFISYFSNYDSIISCGRDGSYKFWNLDPINYLVLMKECFYDEHLIVFNVKTSEILLKVLCGGGHRAWDIDFTLDENGRPTYGPVEIIFIKNRSVLRCKTDLKKLQYILKKPNYCSKIEAIKYCFTWRMGDISNHYCVTAGEENFINVLKIAENRDNSFSYEICEVLQGHLSNIRCLSVLRESDSSCLLISGGGRAQMKIYKIEFSYKMNNVITRDLLSIKVNDDSNSSNPETRIMDIDSIYLSDVKSCGYKFSDKESVLLTAACSDGLLRLFVYNMETNEIKQLNTVTLENCLMKAFFVNTSNDFLAGCGTANGQVIIYSLQELLANYTDDYEDESVALEDLITAQVHENGITAIFVKYLDDGILLITGSDSGFIDCSLLKTSNDCCRTLKTLCKWGGHNSSVTSVTYSMENIISASIDQRIRSWSFERKNKNTWEYHSQDCKYIPIADVSSSATWISDNYSLAALAGCGCTVIKSKLF